MSTLTVKNLQGVSPTNMIMVGSGHKMYVPGHVVQVVQYNYTGSTSIATGTYVALPITATITPMSTSSKILVRCVVHVGATGGNEGLHGRLYRNGSVVPIYGDVSGSKDQAWFHCGAHSSAYEQYPAMAEYLDSPASSGALTYTIYARGHSASYPIYINSNEGDYDTQYTSRTVSSITLMEVAQ